MVLHVLAHAGEVVPHLDAVLAEVRRGPDAGEHQELRRAKAARAKNDCFGSDCAPALAPAQILDAGGAGALEREAQRLRVGHDAQVGAALGRPEIRARRAVPPALSLAGLHVAHAHLRRQVDVFPERHARLDAALDQGAGERMHRADVGDRERAAGAPVLVGAALVILQPAEVGQHGLEVPASTAESRPAVVILWRAPNERGGVDRAGAAQHLAARHEVLAPVAGGVRLRHEAPVVARVGDREQHGRRWHEDGEAAVRTAGFQQQHPPPPVLR